MRLVMPRFWMVDETVRRQQADHQNAGDDHGAACEDARAGRQACQTTQHADTAADGSGDRSQEGVSKDAPGVVLQVGAQGIGAFQRKAEGQHDGSAHLHAMQTADQPQQEDAGLVQEAYGLAPWDCACGTVTQAREKSKCFIKMA